jgi:ribosome maturation factor RimP
VPHIETNISGVDKDALLAVLDPVLSAHGFAAVEVTFLREQGGWVLRVSIEHPTSTEHGLGVTLDVCAEISRDFSHALDVADIIDHPYTLEVASPGIERPLFDAHDYTRFRGKLAKLILSKPAPDGQRALRGTIGAVEGDTIAIEADGKDVRVPIADVKTAHLVFEFGASAGHAGKKKGAKHKPSRAHSHE